MSTTVPALLETWPLATDARWRVLAWPNWRFDAQLVSIFGEFGAALAERDACLCLRHDPATDGSLENARRRVADVAERVGLNEHDLRLALIEGPLTDSDWDRIAASIDAKITRHSPAESVRRKRVDRVHALELRTSRDVGRLLVDQPSITPFDEFWRSFADVPGWFNLPAACIWDSLLTLQSSANVRGNFLEIGVWMGRSALLSTLHSSPAEACVFVDLLPIEEAKVNLGTVRTSGLHFLQATSRTIAARMLPSSAASGYRWIHIDGEHSGTAVEHDLALASSLLGERGIIAIDDFFTPSYPQITFAVVDHLRAHPKSLMMFLCGFNKAYLCHPSDGRWLLSHVANHMIADLIERGAPPITLFKTADPLDLNCFGLGPRGPNDTFRGPDWDKDLLLY